jgi:WD40 repeat protein/serine/threonine protein kinase
MPGDFRQIKEIFLAAVEKADASQREAYLHEACAGDPALRQRVDDLLRQHEQAGSFLAAPGVGLDATLDEPITERPGTVIGPYKLLQQLGEGGMGTVFLAEQTQPVQRQVALKIIKPGMDSRVVVPRFEAERQALALMDHPHIAKVFDAGTTASGRPYFVMELVKGVPITRYCDEHHLTLRQRLELFVPVCQAVQHAHQKGIIHRDLKPSNVLVAEYDDQPLAKVIDFGVAKATGPKLTEHTLFTELGQVVGTLEYMSPEQAKLNALDIDTRSDIYALGVVLYELLTGTTPFERKRLRQAALEEKLRIIREEEPPKPSLRLSTTEALPSIAANRSLEPKKLSGMVRGELDWIVMKCLEKDRNRRYDTASSLGLDVLRYLHEEPVLARSPGTGYRLRKFVRRHPASLALAAISLVAVLALVAFGVGQYYNARLASTNAKLVTTSEQLDEALQAAKAEKAKARHYLYVSQMTLAERARQEGQIGRMMQLLRSVIPESPEEEDLRGFEWYHLWRQYYGEQSRLRGHTAPVTAVAFSPDDRVLASGSADGTVKLWDIVTAKEILTWSAHAKPVTSLAFSPAGHRLVSGSKDTGVKIWDTRTGRELRWLEGHGKSVTAVAYSPDGQYVAIGSEDNTVRVWDADAGLSPTAVYRGHKQRVTGVAFSPDGTTIVSVAAMLGLGANTSGEAVLWRASTGKELLRLEGEEARTSVAFSPDGTYLAVAELVPGSRVHSDSRPRFTYMLPAMPVLKLYNLESHKTPFSFQGHTGLITSLDFSRDGKRLVSASLDQTVRIWDVAARKETAVLHEEASVLAVAVSPDNRRIAAGSEDQTVKLWAPPGSEALKLSPVGGSINNVIFAPDGRWLAAASSAGAVKIWNAATGAERRKFYADVYLRVAWSPDGRCLAVDKRGGFVDPVTGEIGPAFVSPSLYGAAFSPDGKLFATARGLRGPVCIWNRETGACVKRFPVVAGWTSCVAFSPDNKWLAAGSGAMNPSFSAAGSLQVWEVSTGRLVFSFDSVAISAWGVAFSPDGKRLAAGTGYYGSREPGTVHILDTTTWRELYLLKRHTDCVWSVAFSPDGRRLASAAGYREPGSQQGEVKIWDVNAGQEIWTLPEQGRGFFCAAFSPCGRRLATAGRDGAVKIWDGTPLAETPAREAGPEIEPGAPSTPSAKTPN